jgi:hypothetical protein
MQIRPRAPRNFGSFFSRQIYDLALDGGGGVIRLKAA